MARKYKFGHLFLIQISPQNDDIRFDVTHIFEKKSFTAKWKNATESHAAAIFKHPFAQNVSIAQRTRLLHNRLFSAILLTISAVEFKSENYDLSSSLSMLLESDLEKYIDPTEAPLPAVRWLCVNSLMAPSMAKLDVVLTTPEHYERAVELADTAISRYGNEYTGIHSLQARNYFLLGNEEKAIEILDAAGIDHNDNTAMALYALAKAFMHLVKADWSQSANYYCDVFQRVHATIFVWDDLVEFADVAAERGYVCGPYVQVMYRYLRGDRDVDNGLVKQVKLWIDSDASRHSLRKPLDWAQRIGSNPQKTLVLAKPGKKVFKKRRNK